MTAFSIDEAAFLGKLTAGTTHEIRNVLSVIKESAGLMGDLLDLAEAQSFPHEEKFRRMITNILGQVDRGSALVRELNILAHTTDDRLRSVDVQKVLQCLSILYARFCRSREVALTLGPSPSNAFIVTDPVVLHSAVCAVIDLLLEGAPSGSDISMTCRPGERGLEILFSLSSSKGAAIEGDGREGAGEMERHALGMAELLGGALDVQVGEGRVVLSMPG
jgi:signal transduction histidine kinase